MFQGLSKAVNAAVFSQKDNVVSGSDDHTVKVCVVMVCFVWGCEVCYSANMTLILIDAKNFSRSDLGVQETRNKNHSNFTGQTYFSCHRNMPVRFCNSVVAPTRSISHIACNVDGEKKKSISTHIKTSLALRSVLPSRLPWSVR